MEGGWVKDQDISNKPAPSNHDPNSNRHPNADPGAKGNMAPDPAPYDPSLDPFPIGEYLWLMRRCGGSRRGAHQRQVGARIGLPGGYGPVRVGR